MDHWLPTGTVSEIEVDQPIIAARPGRHAVETGGKRHPIVAFTHDGFVLSAEEEDCPRLRGFVDILDGDDPVAHPLVVCAWVRDGLIGYEVKRDQPDHAVAPDYAPGH